eukprot:scaffold6784_cov108-Cylindrotheca_fusiformis.AAC.3
MESHSSDPPADSPLPNNNTDNNDSGEEWACPRCTLLNASSSTTCEVCELDRDNQMSVSAEGTNDHTGIYGHGGGGSGYQQHKFMIRFEHLNPLVANNVIGTTTSIASSGLVGGLMAGPVGAIVGAAGAAIFDGANRLHHFVNQNNQSHRPRFAFTTFRMAGSAMSITMKTSARARKMIVQPVFWSGGIAGTDETAGSEEHIVDDGYWSQLMPRDLRTLQILFLHVLFDNTIRDGDVLYLSREELLDRVSFDHQSSSATAGVSPECIDQNSKRVVIEKAEDLSNLEEHQKVCNICLEDFKEGDDMRLLKPCSHAFHTNCVDQWLCKASFCPICKNELRTATEETI